MIIPSLNQIAFTILGFSIYWYGIIMALAIFVSISLANKLLNTQNTAKKDLIISNAPIIIISGILGARLYFCLLNFNYYINNPLEILNIRQGGLSIHGAIFAGILAFLYIANREKISIFKILNAVSCATILGQSIGRFGNYFNCEAYGLPTKTQTWGLYIPEEFRYYAYRNFSLYHPTFLYESLLDLIGFCILLYTYKKHNELTFFTYLIIYSLIRFTIEGIRIDSVLNIQTIPIAQIVSVILFTIGIAGVIRIRKN